MTTTTLYVGDSSETSARLAASADEMTIVASKKANTKEGRKARDLACNIPAEFLACDVLEGTPYHVLMRAVLQSQAEIVLNKYADSFAAALPTSVPVELFTVAALSADYMSKSESAWIGKDELEALWKQSATWKQIVESEQFAKNKAYQNAADALTQLVLKMSGKVSLIPVDKLDKIVAKLAEEDHESKIGEFVLRRAAQMKQKHAENSTDELDALDF